MKNIDLQHGDCLELMKNIPDCSVDLIVTDCPYKLVRGGCTNKGKNNGILNKEYASNGKLFKYNDISFEQWLPEAYRILKNQTHCYIMINARNMKELQAAAENAGFVFQNIIVWNKGNVTPNRYYMCGYELILMLRKGNARSINNMGTSNVLNIKNQTGKKLHPTEKPVELMKILIENSSNENDIVLDPFMGSGSTGIACVNAGRKFIGMELDEGYFNIAKKRIEENEKKIVAI